jgi:hypothetical protein
MPSISRQNRTRGKMMFPEIRSVRDWSGPLRRRHHVPDFCRITSFTVSDKLSYLLADVVFPPCLRGLAIKIASCAVWDLPHTLGRSWIIIDAAHVKGVRQPCFLFSFYRYSECHKMKAAASESCSHGSTPPLSASKTRTIVKAVESYIFECPEGSMLVPFAQSFEKSNGRSAKAVLITTRMTLFQGSVQYYCWLLQYIAIANYCYCKFEVVGISGQ